MLPRDDDHDQDNHFVLSEEELQELDDYLSREDVGEDTLMLDGLHGFLSALAVGPGAVPAETWFPWIFGADGKEPAWETPAQRERILTLASALLVEIAGLLAREPDAFEIIAPEVEDDGNTYLAPEMWAHGFIRGTLILDDDWSALEQSPAGGALDFIALLAEAALQEPGAEAEGEFATAAQRSEAASKLPGMLLAMRDIFAPLRHQRHQQAITRTAPKVGRNDPCPCGSGKKFKQCCGKNA